MRKEDKALIIENIAKTLNEYSCFYLVETAGLNAEKTSELRRACNKADIKLMVVKNTLLEKALESLEGDYSELYSSLKGSTSIMLSNTGNAPAKLIKEVLKKRKMQLYHVSRQHMLKKLYMLVLKILILLQQSRARTNLSPTLLHSFNLQPRMLFQLLLLVELNYMAYLKHYQTKKHNYIQQKQLKFNISWQI